jgi:hypothetical protein
MISVWSIKKGRGSSSSPLTSPSSILFLSDDNDVDLRRFTGRLSGISNSPNTSKQVLSFGLRGGLKVIISRGGVIRDSEHGVVDVGVVDVDVDIDVEGRDVSTTVDELYEEVGGLRGAGEMGDKRKLRMGRDSTCGLDREETTSS